jgi:hypothetical protein
LNPAVSPNRSESEKQSENPLSGSILDIGKNPGPEKGAVGRAIDDYASPRKPLDVEVEV